MLSFYLRPSVPRSDIPYSTISCSVGILRYVSSIYLLIQTNMWDQTRNICKRFLVCMRLYHRWYPSTVSVVRCSQKSFQTVFLWVSIEKFTAFLPANLVNSLDSAGKVFISFDFSREDKELPWIPQGLCPSIRLSLPWLALLSVSILVSSCGLRISSSWTG